MRVGVPERVASRLPATSPDERRHFAQSHHAAQLYWESKEHLPFDPRTLFR
jgi:hypothetical protein